MKVNLHSMKLKEIIISVIVAFMFMIVAYLVMNLSFTLPMAIEKPKLKLLENIRGCLPIDNTSSWVDSVLCIDVSHDQVLAMEYEGENAIGEISVTDHEKLLKLLQALKNKNYRYILLDVLFDKYVSQPIDSQLFKFIADMPNIVIPIPEKPIANDCLMPKAAHAKYATPHWDGGFTKYPYKLDNQSSIPLFMYEELSNHKIFNPISCIWWDRGLARNSVFLTFGLKEDSLEILNMGRCLGYPVNGVQMRARINNPSLTEGKYIIIGDFKNDRHGTFLGSMSGPMINFNAYVALVNGHHRINPILMSIILLILSVFCYAILYSSKSWRILVKASQVKVITVLLVISCFILYVTWHIIYDVYIYVFLFWSLHISAKFGVGYKVIPTIVYLIFLIFFVLVFSLLPEDIIAYPLLFLALFLPFYKDILKLK